MTTRSRSPDRPWVVREQGAARLPQLHFIGRDLLAPGAVNLRSQEDAFLVRKVAVRRLCEPLLEIAKWEQTSPKWRIMAAQLCAAQNDFTGAIAHLKPLEADSEKLPADVRMNLYQALGLANMQSGNPAGAIDAFKKYLKDQPRDVVVLNNVASLLSEGINPPNLPEATQYAKTLYEVGHAWAPGQGRTALFDTYGWILVLKGGKDLDEGIRVLQEMLDSLLEQRQVELRESVRVDDEGVKIVLLEVAPAASTVRAKPMSVGKRTAVPIATSVPPASRNFAKASTPSPPMPPVMSGDSPYIPRNLYFASFM